MNICFCGAEASYPHKSDCPYPMFLGTDQEYERWVAAREELKSTTSRELHEKKAR